MDSDEQENVVVDQGPSDKRSVLIERYGVSMELPAYYYYNAVFVPHKKDFLVTMAIHMLPSS